MNGIVTVVFGAILLLTVGCGKKNASPSANGTNQASTNAVATGAILEMVRRFFEIKDDWLEPVLPMSPHPENRGRIDFKSDLILAGGVCSTPSTSLSVPKPLTRFLPRSHGRRN